MEQKSFLRRTAIPVLLAIVLVTGIQLMPQRLPEAILPDASADYRCHVTLIENGQTAQSLDLNEQDGTALLTQLHAVRAQNRGQTGNILDRHPLLCQLTFTPVEDGETYELLLDPEGRLFAGEKLYKLQGANPRGLFETVQQHLRAGGLEFTGEYTP